MIVLFHMVNIQSVKLGFQKVTVHAKRADQMFRWRIFQLDKIAIAEPLNTLADARTDAADILEIETRKNIIKIVEVDNGKPVRFFEIGCGLG